MAQLTSFENVKVKHQNGTQSIHRALSIIRIVAQQNHKGVTLSKIARKIGLPSSTTHRILNALVGEEMVYYNPLSKLYFMGFGLYLLGSEAHQYRLRDVCRSALQNISAKTGDTAFLVIKAGYDVLCIDRIVGSTPIQVFVTDVGARRPLGVGAGSLAILASLPENEAKEILQYNKQRYASYKGYTLEDLERMIGSYRRQGYVVNSVTPYTIGVGMSIRDENGNLLGAVSVHGIASKMNVKRQKEISRLIQLEMMNLGGMQFLGSGERK